jgi:AcrR family transcriptional regulator
MPKIQAPTLAQHREQRRDALVDAATTVMRESGTVTMAAVAERTGLSRSAVYEYYRSAADLIADVVVDELAAWIDHLAVAVEHVDDPRQRLETWIRAALAYVADGRHALVRAAGDASLPPVRRAQVQALHRELAAPVLASLRDLGVSDADRIASYVWGVVETATRHIEAGRPADDEVDAAIAFALAGVDLAR